MISTPPEPGTLRFARVMAVRHIKQSVKESESPKQALLKINAGKELKEYIAEAENGYNGKKVPPSFFRAVAYTMIKKKFKGQPPV